MNLWVGLIVLILGEVQYGWSPYHYCGNNPVVAKDDNGKVGQVVVGAAVGAGVEIGAQVLSGLFSGKSISESFSSINWKHVGIATVAGAATGGLSSLGTSFTIKATTTAAQAALTRAGVKAGSVAIDYISTNAPGKDYSIEQAVTGLIVPAVAGKTKNIVIGKIRQGSSKVKNLKHQATRATNIAKKGKSRTAQMNRASDATARYTNYGYGWKSDFVTGVESGAVSTTVNKIIKDVKTETK